VARPCECRDRIVARARLSGVASVIPAKYRGVSFDRPPVAQMNEVIVHPVRKFCEGISENLDQGRGLWFEGSTGSGKTTLAMLVSKTALEAGRSVAIYSVPKLLARIRRTFDAGVGEQSYAEFFERVTEVDLLHLDDLGAENRTEWVLEQLYALINERYESERSVLVTTNRDDEELKGQIGERTISRLAEMCEIHAVYDDDRRWRSREDAPVAIGGSPAEGGGAGLGPLDHQA
jgi:DNA replication protein DnaC